MKATGSIFFLLLLAQAKVQGRSLQYSSSELVSDGINDLRQNRTSSFLFFNGMGSSSTEEECEQLYGFLPCSTNVFGNLFLIAVYEYMLFHGESYVASGGEQIFKILGPGVFGASAFHVLGALPEALILLATGLLSSEEVAQEYVYTAVGLLAGTSILLLTALWGSCVILGRQNLSAASSQTTTSANTPISTIFSFFTEFGVVTDLETCYTARIMTLSAIPFMIVQIPKIFDPNASERVAMLISLVVSVVFLLTYFIYQIFEPWIQKRRLEFVNHEHLILRILEHVQKRALGRILSADGAPDVNAIRRLFEELDKDGDDNVTFSEVKELLLEVKFAAGTNVEKEKALEEVMNAFDLNNDRKITKEEFIGGFTKWLDETKYAMDKRYFSARSMKNIYEVFRPWIENKRREREMRKKLISEIVRHFQSNAFGSLLTQDGAPDLPAIRRLFEEIDRDGDNSISQSELRELVMNMDVPWSVDEAAAKITEVLDASGDQEIDEEEFVTGIVRWLDSLQNDTPRSIESQDDMYQRTWEETDNLVDGNEKSNDDYGAVDKSKRAWLKAITCLVSGVAILSVLAEPLIHSVQSFSEGVRIPSFFVSFILVPLATNARGATSALTAAHRRKPRTTSLTFSEIYGWVFMNNVLGFTVLLSLIHGRGLTWEFSAEVLVVLIVCSIMGLMASFRSNFPTWTSVMAFLLYPSSLFLFYLLNDVLNYV